MDAGAAGELSHTQPFLKLSGTSQMIRTCYACHKPLSEARLKAVPSATRCVTCLCKQGDVPVYRNKGEYAYALENDDPTDVARRMDEGINIMMRQGDWPYSDEDSE